jgi:hypothetical protein
VTILIRLILYIIYIDPILSPPQSPPHSTKSNWKRVFYFFLLQVYEVHQPYTITLISFLIFFSDQQINFFLEKIQFFIPPPPHFYYHILIVQRKFIAAVLIRLAYIIHWLDLPHYHPLTNLLQLQEVSLFCFIYGLHIQPINHSPSPSSPPFILPSLTSTTPPTHTHCTYFTVLSFHF